MNKVELCIYILLSLAFVFVVPMYAKMLIIRLYVSDNNAARSILGIKEGIEALPRWSTAHYSKMEFLATMAALVVIVWFQLTITDPLTILSLVVLLSCLLTIAIEDFVHKIIPDELVIFALGGALIFSIKTSTDLELNILGLMVGYAFPALLRFIFSALSSREGIGLGDCKLLAVIGAWLGVENIFPVIFVSAVIALASFPFTKHKLEDKELPFGPFIVAAALIFHFHQIYLS